jgi:hypothetical protein
MYARASRAAKGGDLTCLRPASDSRRNRSARNREVRAHHFLEQLGATRILVDHIRRAGFRQGPAANRGVLGSSADANDRRAVPIGGLFKSSMLARILFSDHENQYGPSQTVVNRARTASVNKDLSSCEGVQSAEDDLLELMIWKWSNGQKVVVNGQAVHAPYYKRHETVRDTIRKNAPTGGRSQCT